MSNSLAPFSVFLALSGCVILWLASQGNLSLPRVSSTRILLAALWLGLIYLLWVSDYPAAWRIPELVEYLADVTFSAFRILCVTATGAALFGSMVALFFFTRPRSKRR